MGKDASPSYVVIKARQVGGEIRAVHSDSRGDEMAAMMGPGAAHHGGQPAFIKVIWKPWNGGCLFMMS